MDRRTGTGTDEARVLLARLLSRIVPGADAEAIGADDQLPEVLDLDSMGFVALVSALEDETGLVIPVRDYPRVATIDGLAAYLAQASGVGR